MNVRRISPIMVLSILLLQGGLSCIHASPGLEASQETKPLDRLEVIDLAIDFVSRLKDSNR